MGLEPAVRPALAYAVRNGGDVLVLATDVTVRENRFISLCERCCTELGGEFVGDGKKSIDTVNRRENSSLRPRVYAVSIQDTVDYVEKGQGNSEAHTEYLKKMLLPYGKLVFSAVVEGCTHFPFAEKSISEALGYSPEYFDGADGAARYLKRLLYERGITRSTAGGWVKWVDTVGEGGYAERFRGLRALKL
ncbi:MAG: hypothetical protein IJY04_01135 [Clostridia bacterium]|nr:hypothetical protein [Clostridia bacterium]